MSTYDNFCGDRSNADRTRVLNEAKVLDKLMTKANKKAVASVRSFAGASRISRRHTATLDDINNNLRLLLHATRRLTEINSIAVSLSLSRVPYC